MSFIESALTPRGTNARRDQEKQQGKVSDQAYDLINRMYPSLESQIDYSAAREPGRQASLDRAILDASSGNEGAKLAAYGNEAYDNAARAAKQTQQLARNSGVSGALQAGQAAAITNEAQRAVNNRSSYYASPEYHAEKANNLLRLYGQTQIAPGMTNFQNLTNTIYGRPGVMVEPGIGAIVGKIAGDYASKQIGGAAGGGGMAQNGYGTPGSGGMQNMPPNPYNWGQISGGLPHG